jgi:MFS transporter, DHA1 family, multidrug resistance protein
LSRLMYVIIFIVFLDTFIQLPIMTPYALSLGASAALAGFVVSMYSLTNIAGNIAGGIWIDRAGRRRVLLTGMAFVAGIVLLYPMVQNGWQLLGVRFLHGIAGGLMIPAAFALIGDRSTRGSRKVMAYAGAAIGLSAIAGPAAGGILASRGEYESVFFLTSALFVVSFLLVFFFVFEGEPAKRRNTGDSLISVIKNRLLLQACLAAFALMVSNGVLAFALPIRTGEFGLSTAVTGILLSIYGITALIVFISPLNNIYQRFSPFPLVLTGLIFITFSMIILNLAASASFLYAAMVVYGIGFAFIFPSMNQMAAEASGTESRGKAFGIFYACFSLGVVAGAAGAGLVTESTGLPFLSTAFFIIAAVVILAASKK